MTNERFEELTKGLDIQTDLWWVALLVSDLLALLLAALAFPEAGLFWAWLSVLVRFSVFLCLSRQPWAGLFERLLMLGLAAGIFEIFSDYLLVSWKGQRVYAGSAPLLASPLYMPLAWACWIAEFGYPIVRLHGVIARRVAGEMGLGLSMVAGGMLAGVVTTCTDSLAVMAGWWKYRAPAVSVGDAGALYVAAGYFFIFFPFLPVFIRFVGCPGGRLYAAVRYGLIFAGVIFVGFATAHLLIERSL